MPTAPTFELAPGAGPSWRAPRAGEALRGAGARELREATAPLHVPVVLSILPVRSARHARFLHEQVAGILVPAAVRQRLDAAEAGADQLAEGIALAAEMLALAREWFSGAFLMPSFGHYEVVARILEEERNYP